MNDNHSSLSFKFLGSSLSLRQVLQRNSEQFHWLPFRSSMMYHQDHRYQSFAYYMFHKHFSPLMKRLKVNLSIVDYNLLRLRSFILDEYRNIFPENQDNMNLVLDYDEMAIALEYYLQMDVDRFHMKTYSFDNRESYSSQQSLFYNDNNNKIDYTLQPCQQVHCHLCQTLSSSSSVPTIHFNSYDIHRFFNSYEAILNYSATCRTKNIIYVLTCPCGEYEFIGSTKETVEDVIFYYRIQTNCFIHEYLTGLNSPSYATSPSSIPTAVLTSTSSSSLIFSSTVDSLLYIHAVQCPALLEIFLQNNPQYNCFIPMLLEHATENNLFTDTDDSSSLSFITSSTTHRSTTSEGQDCSINDDIEKCLANLPKPSKDAVFTQNQRQQQRYFFQQYLSNHKFFLNSFDLYHVTLLTVFPEFVSCHVRRIIQALLILHAEPKLN